MPEKGQHGGETEHRATGMQQGHFSIKARLSGQRSLVRLP